MSLSRFTGAFLLLKRGFVFHKDMSGEKSINSYLVLIFILVIAALLRVHTFYLPHNNGDQVSYLALAVKLERSGFKDYNLKGINFKGNGETSTIFVSDNAAKGDWLNLLEKRNVKYYSEETLCNMPPAYSYILMLSHKVLARHKEFVTVSRNLGACALSLRPYLFLESQFYAVWINFIFSLLFIYLVFLLGKNIFSERSGLWAAMFIALSPVDILASQRLWAEEVLSVFVLLCVLLFVAGKEKNSFFIIALSGVCAGLAALTKGSGIFIAPVIVLSSILSDISKSGIKDTTWKTYFGGKLLIFVLFFLAVSSFWYMKVAFAYGLPWHTPYQPGIEEATEWFSMLKRRSYFGQFYYFIILSPVFVFFYWESIKTIYKRIFTPARIICLVWFSLFVILLTLRPAKEERYMLPAYPAIAVLSGLGFEDLRIRLNKTSKGNCFGDIALSVFFLASCVWSIYIGLTCVFSNFSIFNLY